VINPKPDINAMRRAEKEISDRAQIDSIIQSARVCRIGLVDGDDAYIVPMNFGYADECLWFHCAKEGRKMDLVRRTGKASFEVDIDEGLVLDRDASKCSNNFKCVMGKGRIGVASGPEDRAKGIEALMRHYHPGDYVVTERCMDKTVVLKLEVESMSCKMNKRD
jgi:nitroimidazol reductase NimA-like FMN-containing flavoprotein (pyridoxamine 5'-phosphate oxidase superfamily)